MNEDEAYEILLYTHNKHYEEIRPKKPDKKDYPNKDKVSWMAAQTAFYLADLEWRLEKDAKEPKKPENYGKES